MPTRHDEAIAHLRRRDKVLRRVIDSAGPCTLRPRRDRFGSLVRSILSQQLATAAARTITARVETVVGPFTPENFAKVSDAQLRGAGVSPQKLGYLSDLCRAVGDGRVNLPRIGRKSDEEVAAELVQIKGIGPWTAHMFLIFSLGRPDIFPVGDLGVRAAIRNLYGLATLPDDETAHRIAAPWRPFASVASWYCWRSLDLKPTAK